MKNQITKGLLMILGFIIMSVVFSACGHKSKETTPPEEIKEVTGMSQDSLCKLGIDLTLWAENEANFEMMVQDTLIKTDVTCEFALSTTGWGGLFECNWPELKQYMLWQGNDLSIFQDKNHKRFVVIGSYYSSDPLVENFSGHLYKY